MKAPNTNGDKIMSIKKTMKLHNDKVRKAYRCNNVEAFREFVFNHIDIESETVEISSNETLSGHAEIINIDMSILNGGL